MNAVSVKPKLRSDPAVALKSAGLTADQLKAVQILTLMFVLITIVVGCVVGATLLRRGIRKRRLPEFAVGMGLFAYSVLSRGLALLSVILGDSISSDAHLTLLIGSTIGSGLGLLGLTLFTWRVFRPASRWTASVFAMVVAGILVTRIGIVSDFIAVPKGHIPSFADAPLWVGLSLVLWTLGYVWASGESLKYYAMLRRRMRLGLTDPVVANRLLLWGVGCGTAGLIAASLGATTAAGMDVHNDLLPQLLQSISGTVGPLTWYLGFMPPAAYLESIRRRAPRVEA